MQTAIGFQSKKQIVYDI